MSAVVPYEERLARDFEWALIEGSLHFENRSQVHRTLKRIAHRLTELQIPYAVTGAMAMFVHGLRRFTEDVDLIVDMCGFSRIHSELVGKGYEWIIPNCKSIRDAETGVRIEFLVIGERSGDIDINPIAIPDSIITPVECRGITYVKLPVLVEMKLAWGLANWMRMFGRNSWKSTRQLSTR